VDALSLSEEDREKVDQFIDSVYDDIAEGWCTITHNLLNKTGRKCFKLIIV